MANEKSLLFFFAVTHNLSLSKAATLCSLLFIFFSTYSSLLVVFFFSKRLPLGCFIFFFFLARFSLSLLLHILSLCLLEGGSTLLSLSSCVPPKRKSLLSLGFMLYFPSSHGENPSAKAIKFFVVLSIYKTLLLIPLGLVIYYLFSKESIPFWIMNTLPL